MQVSYALVRNAWQTGIFGTAHEMLMAIREGRLTEMRIVDRLLEMVRQKTVLGLNQIAERRYKNMILNSDQINYTPLRALISEREHITNKLLRDYRYLINKHADSTITIGRRYQDAVRNLSLQTLEKGFLKGNPTALTADEVINRIQAKRIDGISTREQAEQYMKQLRKDITNAIPVFHEDGKPKFMLNVISGGIYTGRFMAWDAEKYADLVAVTTASEADFAGTVQLANESGTRLIKWNSTGKGKAFYTSVNDHRCAAVDGEIASTVPEGITINNKFYPYYKTLLPGPFNTCHPYCRHRISPLPEEAVGGNSEQSVTASDLLSGLTAKERQSEISKARQRSVEKYVTERMKALKQRMQKMGVPQPEGGISFDEAEFIEKPTTVALYKKTKDKMYFNWKHTFWDSPAESMKKHGSGEKSGRRFFSTSNPDHIILHEFGHLYNFKSDKENYLKLGSESFNFIEKETASKLSYRAGKHPKELLAEAFTRLFLGEKIDDEILKLYKYFGGVIP